MSPPEAIFPLAADPGRLPVPAKSLAYPISQEVCDQRGLLAVNAERRRALEERRLRRREG
jgi:hypothetical protein